MAGRTHRHQQSQARRITDVLATFKESPFSVQTQIREISTQWAGEKALPEMGFTLGGVDELVDPRVKLLYAVDTDGKVLGVTSWLPTYENGKVVGWTLDFMRHRTDSVNGIMEFLIARMAERLRDEGEVRFMSLSAAPLAGRAAKATNRGRAPYSTTCCRWWPTSWNRLTDSTPCSASNSSSIRMKPKCTSAIRIRRNCRRSRLPSRRPTCVAHPSRSHAIRTHHRAYENELKPCDRLTARHP